MLFLRKGGKFVENVFVFMGGKRPPLYLTFCACLVRDVFLKSDVFCHRHHFLGKSENWCLCHNVTSVKFSKRKPTKQPNKQTNKQTNKQQQQKNHRCSFSDQEHYLELLMRISGGKRLSLPSPNPADSPLVRCSSVRRAQKAASVINETKKKSESR